MEMELRAPGKLILGGEHAVVYGQPALAMPFAALAATIRIERLPPGAGLTVAAEDLGKRWRLEAAEPLGALARATLARLGAAEPDAILRLSSTIPIASGMGSGAAVGTVLVRALAALCGQELAPSEVSSLVYESERAFHGTPSGIDNTVIAFARPILFQRRDDGAASIEPLTCSTSWTFVVGDTGVASPTREVVGDLARRRSQAPSAYEAPIAAIGALVEQMAQALHHDDGPAFGALLDANHGLLAELGVSSPELDALVAAARAAGAWGAKLSGAGWGGVMLALVAPQLAATVAQSLHAAGAVRTWITKLEPSL